MAASAASVADGGRAAFVTGGSGVIGREVVRLLRERGLPVHFSYGSNEAVATALAAETGAVAHRVELRDRAALPQVLSGIASVASVAPVKVLVHAAGRLGPLSLAEASADELDALNAVNVDAALLATRALLPQLSGDGSVVFVGALDRSQSLPLPVAFAATQGALATAVMALGHELGREGVRVNLVAAGLLDEGLGKAIGPELARDYLAYSALRRLGTAAELSRVIAWLALDDRVMTGRVVSVNGGI